MTSEEILEQENHCGYLLYKFNEQMKWFRLCKENEEKSIIDFNCIDKKGRTCLVELKERNANIDSYKDILMDATKMKFYADIMTQSGYTHNDQRLYINFMNDGVVIFNLNNISSMNFYPNKKIWNPIKNDYEHRDKYGLKIDEDAIVYKYDENGKLQRVHNKNYLMKQRQ